jgi:hypothetical protein
MQRDTSPTTNANAFTSDRAIARRLAWDASLDDALRTRSVVAIVMAQRERTTPEQRARELRVARQSSTPPPPRVVTRGTRPNEWERDAPRDVHRASDRTCHHPLVKCNHSW